MKSRTVAVLCACLSLRLFAALPPAYETIKSDAEKAFAERSFSIARDQYQKAVGMDLPASEKRWVEFRLADTQWRAQAGTETADPTKLDEAQRQLEALTRELARVEAHDRVWVEVQESLGDFYWTRRNSQNWGAAWPFYQQVLDWWAGAADIEMARGRYLSLVWRAARPAGAHPNLSYGSWGNFLPLDLVENALRIAQSDNDKAHAHYLIAMTLRTQGGDWDQRGRVPEEFEAALALGKKTEWYDDALYNYAQWMLGQGRMTQNADGSWRQEPDYLKALALFQRLVGEFQKGETRYWEEAQGQIRGITQPQLGISVQNIFLPDSEIQYFLNWRNLKRIDLALYPVELNRGVKLEGQTHWLHTINTAGLETLKSWTKDTEDQGDYKPGNATLRLEEKLKPGAYLLEVTGGGNRARELILVTDAILVLKSSGKQALAWFCNALDGEPLAGAKIKLQERWHENNATRIQESEVAADQDGVARFQLARQANSGVELFVSAILKDRQALSTGVGYSYGKGDEPWKIYAFADRPAYRPKETAQWKLIARRYNGSVYSTPADETIEYEISDPRGAKVKAGQAKLNPFGSAWGAMEFTEQMPLGEYRVAFWEVGRKRHIGAAVLFRLEEYKLPEFKVSVQVPEQDGKKKAFRLGEKVEVKIQADYYFGGPVANATVEVLVYQNPFYHEWHRPRELPWFYEDVDGGSSRWNRWYGGQGQVVKRETLKMDASGKASLTFDTPRGQAQDLQYRIEARVTDSSRREIVGNGSIRVTRQRYYLYANAEHNLYRPQDKVSVEFKALDANDQPVQTEGVVKVTRDRWYEIWLDPDGKEVKGKDLTKARARYPVFPPAPEGNRPGWTVKFRGYEHDEVLTRTLKTDTNGLAELAFTPEREGYYRVAWSGEDRGLLAGQGKGPGTPVQAETTIWVATRQTTDLGYSYGGVQILVDKDTFRVGQTAPVMVVAPANNRHVLFTVEGEDLYSYQVIHLEGTVKLVELAIAEQHVPNVFLGAALVSDRQVFLDTKQVVVPPMKNFLTVEVKPDRPQYQPREQGTFTIITRDYSGKPVPAEVAFGLVDESVFYIQQDYAGDPRKFYFGAKRPQQVQTQSTLNQKSYAKLVRAELDQLRDELDDRRHAQSGARTDVIDELFSEGGMGGGGGIGGGNLRSRAVGNSAMKAAAPAPSLALADSAAVSAERSQAGEEPAVQVRSDFRSTVLWQPDLVTDQNGTAVVKLSYPDSLTGWKATARVASSANQFGIAEAGTRTKQPLIVRLQAPRFFLVGDTTTLSAVVNNNTEKPLQVRVNLDLGLSNSAAALMIQGASDAQPVLLTVPANGEARADWTVLAKSAGEVTLRVTGRGDKFADAMEKNYRAYEHGIEKFLAKSGKARGNDLTIKFDLPKERKPGSTSLLVQVTPSMAVTMLDALPYLIDYPYGCTEQTMSRFLPAAITAKTLKDLGVQPEDVMGRLFGGIEAASVSVTQPRGKKDLAELDKIIKAGLERLYDFKHADGGWGWWKDGQSDRWMTAYVVWGLALAREAGVNLAGSSPNNAMVNVTTGLPLLAIESGASYLEKSLVEEEENPDMQAWMLHALAAYNRSAKIGQPSAFELKAFDNLWNNRDKLNAYTRALLALAAHQFGRADQARTLVQNLENGVKRDDRPDTSVLINSVPSSPNPQPLTVLGTAHWGEDGIYWRWSDGGVEATAFALRALLAIDPQNKLIEPVMNWLLKNRRGAQWSNTRDTAIVVLAMNDYLRASGELKSDLDYELLVNGTSVAKEKISGADVFKAPSRFAIDSKLIKEANEIRLKRKAGAGAIYFAVEAKFFSLEEPIAAAGNEIFVKREYHKLVGRPTLLKGYVYEKQPLLDGQTVNSGERVETVITIEAKNNYEYLVFEDLKPAGLEMVQVRSGESLFARELKTGAVQRKPDTKPDPKTVQDSKVRAATEAQPGTPRGVALGRRGAQPAPGGLMAIPQPAPDEADYTARTRWVYQELRDRKVALFLDKLPEGVWEIRYDFRAEVPGQFHALPVLGYAMYVPEIRCNGAETRVNVADAERR
jgi:uncharacterized protein YfaS (alpha-2-macroglobulin family)